jgi:hypothetical protein
MPWYKVTMSDDDIRADRHTQMMFGFADIHTGSGSPRDAAIFGSADLGQEHLFYFSPAAVKIAGSLLAGLSAAETEAPRRSEVALLSGPESAWQQAPFADEGSTNF